MRPDARSRQGTHGKRTAPSVARYRRCRRACACL